MQNSNIILSALAGTAIAAVWTTPAMAGEEVLYGAAPEWVEQTELTAEILKEGPPVVLLDTQLWLEEGKVTTFNDVAFALDSTEALTAMGTLSAAWLPDKGDLTIHKVHLLRDGKIIDVLGEGARFEVLRREARLERRELSGLLTATMTLPGARLGDVLRMATSVTVSDQALGDEVQYSSLIPAQEDIIRVGRMQASWPKDLDLKLATFRTDAGGDPVAQGNRMVWKAELPVAEPDEMPNDAPARYLLPPQLHISSFADWQDVSKTMEPHFRTQDAITAGSPLAEEVATIMGNHSGDKARAAAALQVVQDKISYLANGMDGGNYLPQSPAETWELRFGDCKAKSLLLLAMLREMNIEADVALVASTGGDVLSKVLPMPGNFDHMIVHSRFDGMDYWLDGTSSGARIATMTEVPRFFYALPLTESGSDLVPMKERKQVVPDVDARIVFDQSAGLSVPALYDIEILVSGATGAQWKSLITQGSEDDIELAAGMAVANIIGEAQLVSHEASYDEELGLAVIKASGIITTPWSKDQDRYELTPPAQAAKDIAFEADRARSLWRDIPLRLNGPIYHRSTLEMILPQEGEGFAMTGDGDIDEIIGGVAVKSAGTLNGNRFKLAQEMQSVEAELPADAIPGAKRALNAHLRSLPELRAPEDILETWEYGGANRELLAAHEAAYAQLIADGEPDDPENFINRASFRAGVFDHAGALEDLNAAIEIEPSSNLYGRRAAMQVELGDLAAALSDAQEIEAIDNKGDTYFWQIDLLGRLGRIEEGETLVADFVELAEKPHMATHLEADYLGWTGNAVKGAELFDQALAARPGDPSIMKAACWYSAVWDIVDDEVIGKCTDAIVKADYSPDVLDSRGVAYYRLGEYDKALADFEAALSNNPEQVDTIYMRGIVKLAMGDAQGKEDIAKAKVRKPSVAEQYGHWGFTP